jgi:hypothetical protein
MVARTNLRTKVAKLLERKLRHGPRNGSSVRVEESDYRDYVHVYVTSPRFQGLSPDERNAEIWKWLEDDLTPAEQAKVTLLLTLTPREERDFLEARR